MVTISAVLPTISAMTEPVMAASPERLEMQQNYDQISDDWISDDCISDD